MRFFSVPVLVWMNGTYYASPPQIPSRLTKANTSQMLSAFVLSSPCDPSPGPKIPFADSSVKSDKMKNWMMDGKGSSRRGSGDMPSDIEDRERKTFD